VTSNRAPQSVAGFAEARQRGRDGEVGVIAVANAPCSWGVLEFESKTDSPGYAQVLDEIARSGYAGTELGDWGFMPTDPARLREELGRRRLAMLGAFVTVRLADPSSYASSEKTALETARLLSAVAAGARPVIVLSDEPTADPVRARSAGRVRPGQGLTEPQWEAAAKGVDRIARAVRDETGLRTVFHHHCGAYVETPGEIEALMARTDPDVGGLCLDSGHATYGGGSPLELLRRHRPRIWHVHFKDCEPAVAARARVEEWDYQTAIRHGVFCELGRGSVDFPALLRELQTTGFDGWIVVEQDVLPAMGAPLASATRNREYLRTIGV
jgi:inosose dehydratase